MWRAKVINSYGGVMVELYTVAPEWALVTKGRSNAYIYSKEINIFIKTSVNPLAVNVVISATF